MAERLLCCTLVFLLFLEHSLGQNTCDSIARDLRQQKVQAIAQINNLTGFWRLKFDYFYFEDQNYQSFLFGVYSEEFDNLRIQFETKLKILNEIRNIQNIINEGKVNLQNHLNFRRSLLSTYTNQYTVDKFLSRVFGVYNEAKLLSTQCDPCINTNTYSSCLQGELNVIKDGFNSLTFSIQSYWEELQVIDVVKRWDFINNARKTLNDILNNLNKIPTVQQVKDYYRPNLLPAYNQFIAQETKYHDFWRTDIFLSTATIVRDTLQFILKQVYLQPNQTISNCDYVKAIKNIVDITDKFVSPYQNSFPIWSLEEFATRFFRPIENVSDPDFLIHVLHYAFARAETHARGSIPDDGTLQYLLESYQSPYVGQVLTSLRNLEQMVTNGYCSGISVIQNAGPAAWKVFQCFQPLLSRYLLYFFYHMEYFPDFEKCYQLTMV